MGEFDDVFVTADTHLGHANVIPYCGRPWMKEGDFNWNVQEPGKRHRGKWVSKEVKRYCCLQMDRDLASNWNWSVPLNGTVYHIGDFCLGRSDFLPVKEVSTKTHKEYESKLNGKIVHVMGNHDWKRGVRGVASAVLKVRDQSFFMVHVPPKRVEEIPDSCNVALCGHVHNMWDHQWVGGKLVLNVGMDVRGFRPWALSRVLSEVDRLVALRNSVP